LRIYAFRFNIRIVDYRVPRYTIESSSSLISKGGFLVNKSVVFLFGALAGFILVSAFLKTSSRGEDREHKIWEFGVGS